MEVESNHEQGGGGAGRNMQPACCTGGRRQWSTWFLFPIRYSRTAFHLLVGTNRSKMLGQGTRIHVSRPCLLLIADAGHQTDQWTPPRRGGIHDAADRNSVCHIPQSMTTQPSRFQNPMGIECLSTPANNVAKGSLERQENKYKYLIPRK